MLFCGCIFNDIIELGIHPHHEIVA